MSNVPVLAEALNEENHVPTGESPSPEPQHTQAISRVTVDDCPLCRLGHENIEVTAYGLPHPSFSHWYFCPVADAPVGVLALCDKGPVVPGSLLEMVRKVVLTNRWMVVFMYCEPGNPEVTKYWQTSHFPSIVFDDSIAWVSKNFHDKTDGPAPSPLQEAVVDDSIAPLFEQFLKVSP